MRFSLFRNPSFNAIRFHPKQTSLLSAVSSLFAAISRQSQWIALRSDTKFAGAAEGTRTPDPIITNDVLYHLSYSGFSDPTMALLVLLLCLEPFGFASHSRGDPLITNDVLYHLSYSGLIGAFCFMKQKPTSTG